MNKINETKKKKKTDLTNVTTAIQDGPANRFFLLASLTIVLHLSLFDGILTR